MPGTTEIPKHQIYFLNFNYSTERDSWIKTASPVYKLHINSATLYGINKWEPWLHVLKQCSYIRANVLPKNWVISFGYRKSLSQQKGYALCCCSRMGEILFVLLTFALSHRMHTRIKICKKMFRTILDCITNILGPVCGQTVFCFVELQFFLVSLVCTNFYFLIFLFYI